MNDKIQLKECRCCGIQKPYTEFNVNRSHTDGLQSYCKACVSKKMAEAYKKKTHGLKTDNKSDNPLATFKPRELIEELRRRGYRGKITYTQEISL